MLHIDFTKPVFPHPAEKYEVHPTNPIYVASPRAEPTPCQIQQKIPVPMALAIITLIVAPFLLRFCYLLSSLYGIHDVESKEEDIEILKKQTVKTGPKLPVNNCWFFQ